MRILLIISTLFLFSACDPAKQIMKSVEKFEEVGAEWAIRNPSTPKVETISKRDTVFRVDSVKNTFYVQAAEPGGVDTVYHETVINNRFYYQDSIINNVTDTRQLAAYAKLLQDAQVLAVKNEVRAETVQKQLKIAIIVAAVFFLALILMIILLLKR